MYKLSNKDIEKGVWFSLEILIGQFDTTLHHPIATKPKDNRKFPDTS